ncbi:hypothetical protein E8P82_01795 [Arthrobacter echini]|uniref:DUF308 domain-containing protein n=1 Tax=Arthrobacter echini TaxID=1529066 RepID=A0A4S5EAD2_9MICC|nr:DUF308 domain-containing protein [Arthrobacter echini]THJ68658.1 hypothetical protein E8P82_01795 [Arthrobacter echini]
MATAPLVPGSGTAGLRVWRPLLARAVLSAVFGLLTVFWREPSTLVVSVAGGLYLLIGGAGYLWTHQVSAGLPLTTALTRIGGGLLLGAGVVSLVFADDRSFALAGSVALFVAGIAELIRGLGDRRHPAARDFVLVGVIGLATGLILPFVEDLGPQALLGVSGGGALLSAVVLGIAALSYRHDSAVSASEDQGARSEPDTVN